MLIAIHDKRLTDCKEENEANGERVFQPVSFTDRNVRAPFVQATFKELEITDKNGSHHLSKIYTFTERLNMSKQRLQMPFEQVVRDVLSNDVGMSVECVGVSSAHFGSDWESDVD